MPIMPEIISEFCKPRYFDNHPIAIAEIAGDPTAIETAILITRAL